MKIDSSSKIVAKDQLLKEYGAMMIEKQGGKDVQFSSQKMRDLGHLVEGLMVVEGNTSVQLSDFLKPEKFDTIVKAIRDIAGFNSGNCQLEVGIPSPALKLGYSIQKCACTLSVKTLCSKDDLRFREIKNFQKIMKSEWEYRVSHHSLTSLHERRFNKVHVLPLAEDMTCLMNFIDQEIVNETRNLRENPTAQCWTLLAKLLLSRAVMLNKRRGGEASKLLLISYNNRPNRSQSASSEIMASLSSWEQQLSVE
jgi:hypothetical protein